MSKSAGDGPEDVDATFEEIVADLRAEGLGSTGSYDTKRATDPPPELEGKPDAEPGAAPEPEPGGVAESLAGAGAGWREGGAGWDETMFADGPLDSDDEHYVPPEPPPIPKPRRGAFIVLLFFVLGLLLLISPTWLGLNETVGTPLGLLALATGIALLLLRVRHGPPDGADPTNGAQV